MLNLGHYVNLYYYQQKENSICETNFFRRMEVVLQGKIFGYFFSCKSFGNSLLADLTPVYLNIIQYRVEKYI